MPHSPRNQWDRKGQKGHFTLLQPETTFLGKYIYSLSGRVRREKWSWKPLPPTTANHFHFLSLSLSPCLQCKAGHTHLLRKVKWGQRTFSAGIQSQTHNPSGHSLLRQLSTRTYTFRGFSFLYLHNSCGRDLHSLIRSTATVYYVSDKDSGTCGFKITRWRQTWGLLHRTCELSSTSRVAWFQAAKEKITYSLSVYISNVRLQGVRQDVRSQGMSTAQQCDETWTSVSVPEIPTD